MEENNQDCKELYHSELKDENSMTPQNDTETKIINILINEYKIEKREETNQITISYNEPNDYYSLTEDEILKAKENSFILLGKTGVGKTSLLNIIYDKAIGKVGHSLLSEIKDSKYYSIKERRDNQNNYFCIIDTPGLYDTGGIEVDEIQKREIMKLISKEKIKVKGLLFLSNFQCERFDVSEQSTLIDYINLFPLQDFWKRIIFVFTHYYGDPDSYSKEEMKQNSNIYQSELLYNLMEKVKTVCTPIKFEDLNFKYINIYNRNLNKLKINNNSEIRNEMIEKIIQYTKLNPMFNKLEIINFENFDIEKNGNYVYNCDLYIYFDSNNNIVHKEFNILNAIPKHLAMDKEENITFNIEDIFLNEEGNFVKRTTKKEGLLKIISDYKGEIGEGVTLISIIGIVVSIAYLPIAVPLCLLGMVGGSILREENIDDKKEKQKRKEEIMKNQEIIDLIKKELKKFKELHKIN